MSATPGRRDDDGPWYRDGLGFQCSMCGNCCTGAPGAVWFDDVEAREMASAMGMKVREFMRRFTRRLNGKFSLKERQTRHGYDCILLDRETQPGRALCRVYRARPTQCRTWPWWSENLVSRAAWDHAMEATPCPGMGKGPVVPLAEITIRLTESEAATRRCAESDW